MKLNLKKLLAVALLVPTIALGVAPTQIAPFKTTTGQMTKITGFSSSAGQPGPEFTHGASGLGTQINLIPSPNQAVDWSSTGSGVTVATTTTSSELPSKPLNAIKITPVSGTTDYAKTNFPMVPGLYNTKLKLEWLQKPLSGYASGDLKVDVYNNTAADCSGTYARVPLSTDSSAVTSIPNYTGKFTTYFDTNGTSLCYEVRIGRVSGTTALVIGDVVLGNGIQPQGAVVQEWQSCTTTGSWVSNTTYSCEYRRVGDSADFDFLVSLTGAPTATTLTVNLPNSYTIDTSKLTSTGNQLQGTVTIHGPSDDYISSVNYTSTSAIKPINVATSASGSGVPLDFGSITATSPVTFASGNYIRIKLFAVPISQWGGNGVVNLAQNDVEYVFNTSTSTSASDSTSFGYGPAGAQIQNITSALRRRVQFQTPIQASDSLSVEVSPDHINWLPLAGGAVEPVAGTGNTITIYTLQSGTEYGMGRLSAVSGSSTQVEVTFGTYAQAASASYAGAGVAWSTTGLGSAFWRVKKVKGGAAVGFGQYQPGASSGLVSGINGVAGFTDGSSANAGYVGETISCTLGIGSSLALTSNTTKTVCTLALTAGTWEIQGVETIQATSGTPSISEVDIGVSKTTNTTGNNSGTPTSGEIYIYGTQSYSLGGGNNIHGYPLPSYVYSTSSSLNLFLINTTTWSSGSVGVSGYLQAVRIR